MKPNVTVIHRRLGKLVDRIVDHNVWPYQGRKYLAEMVGLVGTTTFTVPERVDRLKYLGLGIGGKTQTSTLVDFPPFTTAYPVGHAPLIYPPTYTVSGASSGKQYEQGYPISPRLDNLERPVRRRGGEIAYPGISTDEWYVGPPALYVTHSKRHSATVHASISAPAGDYVYGTFTSVPISEAGLFLSSSTPLGVPYETLVAYVGFSTVLLLNSDSELELVWEVRFG
jgi:hypothetical protein